MAGDGGDMILAVYDDNDGPYNLLGVTASTPVSDGEGWQKIDLTAPVEVYTGETIWLAWVYEDNPGIRCTAGSPGRVDAGAGWSGLACRLHLAAVPSQVLSIRSMLPTVRTDLWKI